MHLVHDSTTRMPPLLPWMTEGRCTTSLFREQRTKLADMVRHVRLDAFRDVRQDDNARNAHEDFGVSTGRPAEHHQGIDPS